MLPFFYASIGFSITENFFANHELSLTANVNDVACLNDGWSNVVYLVSTQDIADPCKNGDICIYYAPLTYYCNTGDTHEGTVYTLVVVTCPAGEPNTGTKLKHYFCENLSLTLLTNTP